MKPPQQKSIKAPSWQPNPAASVPRKETLGEKIDNKLDSGYKGANAITYRGVKYGYDTAVKHGITPSNIAKKAVRGFNSAIDNAFITSHGEYRKYDVNPYTGEKVHRRSEALFKARMKLSKIDAVYQRGRASVVGNVAAKSPYTMATEVVGTNLYGDQTGFGIRVPPPARTGKRGYTSTYKSRRQARSRRANYRKSFQF
jgi:hypothetical protein